MRSHRFFPFLFALVFLGFPARLTGAQSIEELLGSAHKQRTTGDFDGAIRLYQMVLEQDASSGVAQAGVIFSLLKKDDVSAADAASRVALSAAPDSAEVRAAAGDVLFRMGRIPEAEQEYLRAMRLDGKLARGWWGVGRVAWATSNRKRAKQWLETAHRLDPTDPDIILSWAGTLETAAEKTQALETFLELAPYEDSEFLDSIRSRINLLRQLGDRKTYVLASPYQKTELPLKLLPRERLRAPRWGVEVRVNGSKPLTLLLDSGGPGILLNRKVAEKAGAKRLADKKIHGIGDQGPVSGYWALVERVQIGSVELHDCVVEASNREVSPGEDGVLGTDVFSKFLVSIDFPARALRLDPWSADGAPPDENQLHDRVLTPERSSFTPVYRFGHSLVIEGIVNEQDRALFLIDTGASINSITARLAKQVADVERDRLAHVRGVSGRVKEVFKAEEVAVRFARFRQQNIDMFSFDTKKINRSMGTEISGILGMPMLIPMTLVIDYPNGLVDFHYQLQGTGAPAQIYAGTTDPRRAIKEADKLIRAAEDDRARARAHEAKGDALLVLAARKPKKLKDAEAELRAALKLQPDNPGCHLKLAIALLKQSRDREGQEELEDCLQLAPVGPHVELARKLLANPRRARENYAPQFRVTTLQGETLSLASLSGKVVVLDFWGTWCPPCVRAVRTLKKLLEKYASEQVVFVSISSDRDEKKWRDFIAKHQMDWPQYWDATHRLCDMFRVQVFPTYLVIDGEGIIRKRFNATHRLKSAIEPLLGAKVELSRR